LPGVFPAGPLKAQIEIEPFASPTGPALKKAPSLVSRSPSLWAIPWLQILLFILLVAAVFALWKWRRKRAEHMKAALAAAEERGRRDQAEQDAAERDQPTTDQPAAEQSATEQPTTEQPTTDLATTPSPDGRP
jgi:flagellar biosynthesis/type III secretory pathway M-ring protein FliF/YscJ